MVVLRWLGEGWGYEVTSIDVVEAYDRAMDTAAGLNHIDDVTGGAIKGTLPLFILPVLVVPAA
jgi:hypothetical protein